MVERKVIIKCASLFNHEMFENVLRDVVSAEYDIRYEGNLIYLNIYDFNDSFNNLHTVFNVISNDFLMNIIVLVVPLFDAFMERIIDDIKKPGLYNAYEVLSRFLIEGIIKKDEIPSYLLNINKELLDIFIIYFESGLNICLTSRLLYLHRNTLNYKLTKLSEELNIDIRDSLNANFIYLLVKILSN